MGLILAYPAFTGFSRIAKLRSVALRQYGLTLAPEGTPRSSAANLSRDNGTGPFSASPSRLVERA